MSTTRPVLTAIRAGLTAGRIELRQTFTNGQDLWNYLFPPVIMILVMFFMRNSEVQNTGFSLATMTLPSTLGMGIAFTGLMSTAAILVIDREDGTLLRAKAIPHGMIGYLVRKIVLVTGMSLVSFLLLLLAGSSLFDGLQLSDPHVWLTLAWLIPIGLLATMPIGAVLGSIISNARNMGVIMVPNMALIGISGIFYPITEYPGWLQGIAQVFPIYWLGLGMRSAMLPDAMVTVEIADSWRHWETFGVLAAWAVVGLIVAPIVLRRMARRESGSSVAARREKALQRTF